MTPHLAQAVALEPTPRYRVRASHPSRFAWLEQRTGCVLTRNARAIEAVDGEGRVRGMVGYDGWTENAVQAHMAVETPSVWRSLLRPAFSYPFLEAGKGLLLGVIPAHNGRSVRLVRRLGFRMAHEVRDGWAQGDSLLLFEMRRDECKWLQRSN